MNFHYLPYVRYKNVAKEKSAGVALIELIDFLSFAVEKNGHQMTP